jgi:histidine triad (HIT) family protein
MNRDCLFCRVVAGDIPSQKVAETDTILAFRDINPAAPQHVLLIPKAHVASLTDFAFDLPEMRGIWTDLGAMAQRIAGGPEYDGGWRLVANTGPDGGQTVFHFHLHLLSGRAFSWPPG